MAVRQRCKQGKRTTRAQELKRPTKLTDEQYINCWQVVKVFLSKNETIRNQQLRKIVGIGYDQAISFFNRAVVEKRLIRRGVSSGTHYVLKG